MTPLASWYRRNELHAAAELSVSRAVAESVGAEAPPHPNANTLVDAWLLRGIPAVGVHGGRGGAIRNTKPHDLKWDARTGEFRPRFNSRDW